MGKKLPMKVMIPLVLLFVLVIFISAFWYSQANAPKSTPVATPTSTVMSTLLPTPTITPTANLNASLAEVSGTIIFYPIRQAEQPRIATLPSGIQFVQIHLNSTGSWIKGETYTGVVAENSYSITVPNDQWYVPQIIDSSGTAYVCDQQQIYIGLQVGNTSITENLSRT